MAEIGKQVYPKQSRGPDQLEFPVSGWRGMYTQPHESPIRPGLAHFLSNCRSNDPIAGGPILSRTTAAREGTSTEAPACLFQFDTGAGVALTGRLLVSTGIQTYDWAGTWTTRVTRAQILAAGVTLPAVGFEVLAVVFNKTVVFSDGANLLWTWDGTNGGGIVSLTNCPVAYGRPTVYYGKLFVIKNAERNTIDWSEENQANTGYEAGGFNNSWSLTQTGTAPLVAIIGTNAGLYYFRNRSCGVIKGAVNPDFVTTGVHDAVSTTLGCGDFRSVLSVENEVWWCDAYSRPHYLPAGGAPVDLTPGDYIQYSITPSTVQLEPFGNSLQWVQSGKARGASFTQGAGTGPGSDTSQVWFAMDLGSFLNVVLVYDVLTHLAQSWYFFRNSAGGYVTMDKITTVVNAYGVEVIMFYDDLGSTQHYAFGTTWKSEPGDEVMSCLFIDSPLISSEDVDLLFHRLDAVARIQNPIGSSIFQIFSLQWLSPTYFESASLLAKQDNVLDVTNTSGVIKARHLSWGLKAIGRWLRPMFTWSPGTGPGGPYAIGGPQGIASYQLTAIPMARTPAAV